MARQTTGIIDAASVCLILSTTWLLDTVLIEKYILMKYMHKRFVFKPFFIANRPFGEKSLPIE